METQDDHKKPEDLIRRRDHAQAVADRMVERALWIINLDHQIASVSPETRGELVEETTDMLLEWAYEVGEDSFRAGEFKGRPGAAGENKPYPSSLAKATPQRLGRRDYLLDE